MPRRPSWNRHIKRLAHSLVIVYCALWLPVLVTLALVARLTKALHSRTPNSYRLLWAGAPLPSLATSSRALAHAGYRSHSLASHATFNTADNLFDEQLERAQRLPFGMNALAYCTRAITAFCRHLLGRDVVHMFFSGGVLNQTPLRDWEPRLWKLSGAHIVLMPYGSDAFVYNDLPDTLWAEELRATYPRTTALDEQVARRIAHFTRHADVIVGCIVHTATLPRVDVWPVLWYPPGDLPDAERLSSHEGVRIAHPTNHRAIKGTDTLIAAVKQLRGEGHAIELDIIEGVDVHASRARIARADIVFDQLHMGYAMTAIEGMALGKPVLSGISGGGLYAPFREHSYLGECPIVSVTPETLADELRQLILSPALRNTLGANGRAYVDKRHSNAATVDLFTQITVP